MKRNPLPTLLASKRMKTASSDQSKGVPGSHPHQGMSQSRLRCANLGGRRQVSSTGRGIWPGRLSNHWMSGWVWVSGSEIVAQTMEKIQKIQILSTLRRAFPPLPFRSHQARPPRRPSCSGVVRVSAGHDGTCSWGWEGGEGRGRRCPASRKSSKKCGGREGIGRTTPAHVTVCEPSFPGPFSAMAMALENTLWVTPS